MSRWLEDVFEDKLIMNLCPVFVSQQNLGKPQEESNMHLLKELKLII